MMPTEQIPIHRWMADDPGPPVHNAIERLARAPDVRQVAVMPDVHLAEHVCIGCVIATEDLVYPHAVGADIGCGFTTCAIDLPASDLRDYRRLDAILAGWTGAVPIMRHPGRASSPEVDPLTPSDLSDRCLTMLAERIGRVELGTLGRGNHFLELQRDPDERVWILVHSGSRAMGPAITEHHLQHSERVRGGLRMLNSRTEFGAAYLHDAAWATRYASANRRHILDAALASIEHALDCVVTPGPVFDSAHNTVQRVSGRLIHRKGANEAARDQPGVIPGSMGTRTAHVIGRGRADSMDSSSHGAGRRMSRAHARARLDEGTLRRQLARVHTGPGPLRRFAEEAPSAYRDLETVLLAQRELVRVTSWLRPMTGLKGA